MSLYPKSDAARKALPVLKMITGYFPKALREVTRVCVVNNVRYSPDKKPADIQWARGKSTDQFGAIYRHITEYIVDGAVFEEVPPEVQAAINAEGFDRVYVLAEAAWRALAALELCIEEQEAKVPYVKLSLPTADVEAIRSKMAQVADEVAPPGESGLPCTCGQWDGHTSACPHAMIEK